MISLSPQVLQGSIVSRCTSLPSPSLHKFLPAFLFIFGVTLCRRYLLDLAIFCIKHFSAGLSHHLLYRLCMVPELYLKSIILATPMLSLSEEVMVAIRWQLNWLVIKLAFEASLRILRMLCNLLVRAWKSVWLGKTFEYIRSTTLRGHMRAIAAI